MRACVNAPAGCLHGCNNRTVDAAGFATHRESRSSRSASLSIHTDLALRRKSRILTSRSPNIPNWWVFKNTWRVVLCNLDLLIPLALLCRLEDPNKTRHVIKERWFEFRNLVEDKEWMDGGSKVSQVWLTVSPRGPGGPSTFPSSPCSPCRGKSKQWR